MRHTNYDVGMVKERKTRMGRPPIDPEKRRCAFLNLRMTQAERAAIQAEADRLGITPTDVLMRPWRKGK